MNLDTALNLALRATGTKTIGGVSAGEDPFVQNIVDALTTGSGLDLANKSYHLRKTITAGGTDNVCHYGVVKDAFGDFVNLSRIKCMVISLAGKGRDSTGESLYQLYVGGHSSRAWDTWGVTGVAQLIVKAGGVGLLWAPGVAAYPVMYSTVDVLKIRNVGSAAVNYDVIFIGTSQA